ncbi:MAG: phosphoribosylglycinamide formyltransferase [Pseudomonadota bacterium]
MSQPRVAILLSGGGSNMEALVTAMADGRVAGTPALVLSSEPDAGGLDRASRLGVATAAVDWRDNRGDRAAHDAAVAAQLADAGTDIIALAGYMRIMSADFVASWQGRMINIHPSILPLFKGLNTHARALEAGMAVHGCTVHEVIPDLDSGPILGQAVVPILAGDTSDALAARVLRQEHRLYPRVLDLFLRDAKRLRAAPLAILADEAA